MRLRRALLLSLAVGLVGAGAYALHTQQTSAPPPKVPLPTIAATMGTVEEAVLASGTLEPIQQVSVGAQVSGRLISLKVQLGQEVAKGDLIAEIDGVTRQNELRTAEAEVAVMKAQRDERLASLAYAESVLARQKQMLGQNAVSRDNYESAEMTVRTTRAQVAALDAQIISGGIKVETARANLAYTRITAPAAGTVLAIVTQEGQTVNANQSAPTIVVLGDVSTMTIKAKISEADVERVKAGQEAFFSALGAPDRRVKVKIAFVEPAPDTLKSQSSGNASASSGTSSSSSSSAIYYNALFEVPNPDGRLLTSMTVQVSIVVGRAQGVVVVPSTALRRRVDGTWLDVVGPDGNAVPRKVRVGLDNRILAEIASGLAVGERVLVARPPSAVGPAGAAHRLRGPLGF